MRKRGRVLAPGLVVIATAMAVLHQVCALQTAKLPLALPVSPPVHEFTPLQLEVVNVTRVTFRRYMDTCMGWDEFVPLTGACEDWFGLGLTVLDSIDTLLLMGLTEEYEASRAWAVTGLDVGKMVRDAKSVSMFEIVIRALGGLNSAYYMSRGDALWRDKAVQLADLLLPSFNSTNSGCPMSVIELGDSQDSLSVLTTPAEAGTLQLEFRTLSEISGDSRYARAVDRCMASMLRNVPEIGLVPERFNIMSSLFVGNRLGIGGGVDSFYEMMLKSWVAGGKRDDDLKLSFERAVDGIYSALMRQDGEFEIISDTYMRANKSKLPVPPSSSRMEHLSCFFPGTLAVAALHGLGGGLNGTRDSDYIPRARRLTKSCYAMVQQTHGLAGEVTRFDDGIATVQVTSDESLLRPEIVESLVMLHRVDANGRRAGTYQKWGRDMWDGIRRTGMQDDGVLRSTQNLASSEQIDLQHTGKLHSFVLAETMKYFFLLFSSSDAEPLNLTEWVFNTEAHPVPVQGRRLVH